MASVQAERGIIEGIGHTRDLRDRHKRGIGFVVTDGFRGDFSSLAEASRAEIAIATLDDIELIAVNHRATIIEPSRRAPGIWPIANRP